MISSSIFRTLVFPWVLLDSEGEIIDRSDGLLFETPLGVEEGITSELCKGLSDGFHRCPKYYAIYVRTLPFRPKVKIVLFGLKVVGVSKFIGKSKGLSIKLGKEYIERYIDEFVTGVFNIARDFGDLLNSSVHEIRSINADIKNASYEIIDGGVDPNNFESSHRRARNITGLSEILSTRISFLDIMADPLVNRISTRRVQVFRKFDKVKRSLEPRANKRNISVYINTTGRSDAEIECIDVFDIIPYILIQNAIKYSPVGGKVTIDIIEDRFNILIKVKNKGPKLSDDDFSRLFRRGQRGQAAAEAGVTGTGYGLFFLKYLLSIHGGTVRIDQSGVTELIDRVEYRETTVALELQRAA